LLLRPLIAAEADWLADLRTDPEVNRFLADGALSRKAACQTAEAIVSLDRMKCQFGHWAIQDKGTGVVHGWTDLSKLRPWSGPSDEIPLSYVLRRASWGQGIATEAAGRLLRCAFEVQQLDRVMAVMMAGNAVSERVLQNLGMRSLKAAGILTLFSDRCAGPAGPSQRALAKIPFCSLPVSAHKFAGPFRLADFAAWRKLPHIRLNVQNRRAVDGIQAGNFQ
jgi:RimJ/RimL family protein N-acetyltransferase